MLMAVNKSVTTINALFKILYIMSLRSIYLYIYIYRFGIGALKRTRLFPICKCTKMDINRLNWTEWKEVDRMDKIGSNWNMVDQIEQSGSMWIE